MYKIIVVIDTKESIWQFDILFLRLHAVSSRRAFFSRLENSKYTAALGFAEYEGMNLRNSAKANSIVHVPKGKTEH